MWDLIKEHFKGELKIFFNAVKKAWFLLGLSLALTFWIGLSWKSSEHEKEIDNLRKIHADELRAKDEQKATLETQLAGFRERLNLNPPLTKYSKMSNQDLQIRALLIVNQLQNIIEQSLREINKLENIKIEAMNPSLNDTKRNNILEKYGKEIVEAHQKPLRMYQKEYQADATALKNEIISRLPLNTQVSLALDLNLYEAPLNLVSVQILTTDLERLAKSLPTPEIPTPSTPKR